MKVQSSYFLLAILFFCLKANADCQPVNGWRNRPLAFNFPNQFVIPSSLPVGSVFYETKISENHDGEKYATCPAGATKGIKYLTGWTTDSNGVAPTNVPGVGVRIHWLYPAGTSRLVPQDPYETLRSASNLTWKYGPEWKVELIKTGAVSGGTLQTGSWATYGVGNYYVSELRVMGGGKIVTPGCSLLASAIDVPLGRHLTSEFNGPGSGTPWKSFNIPLRCEQGTKIDVRITANTDTSSAPGVMKLDSQPGDMAADGVGIQLWYRPDGGSAVVFGQDRHYYTSLYGGNEVVKLQARYYQTGQRITAGIANGTATFTITYR